MTARIFLVILATGCVARSQRLATTTLPVQGHIHVRIVADDGDIRVSSADIAQVEMSVTAAGYAQDELELGLAPNGNVVDVVAKTRNHIRLFSFTRKSLHVDIRIPRDADVEIRSGDGSVEANQIAGGLDVHTGDGSVTVSQAWGRINLRTGDGSIHARDLDGAVTATTGDGSVDLDGRFDVLAVRTGDGGLDANARPGSRVAAAWDLHTGDGSIALHLPRDLQTHIDASTHDGSVHSTIPLQQHGSSHLDGDLNGGGPPIVVRTGDGSIHLDEI